MEVSTRTLGTKVEGGKGAKRSITRSLARAEELGYMKTLRRGGGNSPSLRELTIPEHMAGHHSLRNEHPEYLGIEDSGNGSRVANSGTNDEPKVANSGTNERVHWGQNEHLLGPNSDLLGPNHPPKVATTGTLSSEVDEVDRSRGDNPGQFSHVEISPQLQDLVKKLRG